MERLEKEFELALQPSMSQLDERRLEQEIGLIRVKGKAMFMYGRFLQHKGDESMTKDYEIKLLDAFTVMGDVIKTKGGA